MGIVAISGGAGEMRFCGGNWGKCGSVPQDNWVEVWRMCWDCLLRNVKPRDYEYFREKIDAGNKIYLHKKSFMRMAKSLRALRD